MCVWFLRDLVVDLGIYLYSYFGSSSCPRSPNRSRSTRVNLGTGVAKQFGLLTEFIRERLNALLLMLRFTGQANCASLSFQFATFVQRHDGIECAAIGDEMASVFVEATSPPPSGRSLVGFDPSDTFLDLWMVCGDTRISQNHDSEARLVSITGWVGYFLFRL